MGEECGKYRDQRECKQHNHKMIMEMLANLTSPSCTQANILSVAHVMNPSLNVHKELPCLKFFRGIRNILLLDTKTLAPF